MRKFLYAKIKIYEKQQVKCLDEIMFYVYNYGYNFKRTYKYAFLKLIYNYIEVKIQICKNFVRIL